MSKAKSLLLSSGWTGTKKDGTRVASYRIDKITNSVEYEPGAFLHKPEVETLCASKGWTVTIKARES